MGYPKLANREHPSGDRQHLPTDQAAPERISLLPDDGWSWCAGSPPMEPDRIEYIRADLVEDADMAECAAFFAGYDAGEAGGRADLSAPSAPAEVEGLVKAANAVPRDKLDEIEAQIGRECRDRDVPIGYRKLMWALSRLDQRKEEGE